MTERRRLHRAVATMTGAVTLLALAVVAHEPQTGRLMLFFITEMDGRWWGRSPGTCPFWSPPQPIASVPVRDLAPGGAVEIDATSVSFPSSLDALDGPARIQAVLDVDDTERSHVRGPGNIFSEVVTAELDPDREDHVRLTLQRRVGKRRLPPERENLKWIKLRSPSLSAFYGRDVFHLAGVALPPGYLDDDAPRREWPTIYRIPGYGGRFVGATDEARMLATAGIEDIAPMAVHVVLDPESPLGHHGFVDSPNHGPRGTALVRELIPYLEGEFRLVARPEARVVTGYSSGGWSALWLELRWPDVFGACWASAPDPVDFSAF